MPDQIIENGTHVVTRGGVRRAVLEARQIEFYNSEALVEADTMEMVFFDTRGVEESRLTARYGEIDQRTEDVLARGDVLVIASDGTRIEGEELRYDSASDRITSDRPVTIVREGSRIRGDGVEADPALTSIRITGSSAVLDRTPGLDRRRRARAADSVPGPAPPPPAPAARDRTPAAPGPAPSDTAPAEGAGPSPAANAGAPAEANADAPPAVNAGEDRDELPEATPDADPAAAPGAPASPAPVGDDAPASSEP